VNFFSPLDILTPTCKRHPIQRSQVCCNCMYNVLLYQETLYLPTQCLFVFYIIIIIIIKQVVQCFHIFLCPFDNNIILFLQLPMSFQSSCINPFSPTSPLIPSAQVSLALSRFLLPGGLHFITSFGNLPSSIL